MPSGVGGERLETIRELCARQSEQARGRRNVSGAARQRPLVYVFLMRDQRERPIRQEFIDELPRFPGITLRWMFGRHGRAWFCSRRSVADEQSATLRIVARLKN